VDQHRTVFLIKDVLSDLDDIIETSAEEIFIECGVVEFAEEDAVL
jgi:hypothetical protein